VVFPELEPMRRTGKDYYGTGGVLAHSIAAVKSLGKIAEEFPPNSAPFIGPLAHLK
jgi:hypothetical protein